jgi:hypothetical protein
MCCGYFTCLQLRLPDVERNGYCFSDGVSVISPLLLEEVLAALPFAPRGPAAAPTSTIQVREVQGLGAQNSARCIRHGIHAGLPWHSSTHKRHAGALNAGRSLHQTKE